MKKITRIIIACVALIAIIGGAVVFALNQDRPSIKLNIVATNFAGYDFARTIVKNVPDASVEMLLPAGTDLHAYEPTPGDIAKIAAADLFIYNGGESEAWVDEILSTLPDVRTIKMMDAVDVKVEELPAGAEEEAEEEVEYDEHIWTSFENAIKITKRIASTLTEVSPEQGTNFITNANAFEAAANSLKTDFKNMVASAKRQVIVFGDKFPLRYFVDEMGLTYYAAFPGCAEETEASPQTIANLISAVKTNNLPVVFKIELSSGNIAKTIADETGAKILEFNTMHNISKDDFDAGATFISIMQKNLSVLTEALN